MADRFHTTSAQSQTRWGRSLPALGSQDDVTETLDGLAKRFGLRGYLLINVPSETSTDFSSNVLMTSWPDEMLKTYDHAGLIFGSPVIERLRQSTNPFTYDADGTNRRRTDGKAAIAASLFEKHGMTRGAYFPAHNSAGLRGALAFGPFTSSLTASVASGSPRRISASRRGVA